ncbi:MAG: DUF72 domain-containing protein [Mycobacteriaceae bacterium]|nr:DUF72 domain-containing protein [Mycobacteriaceae bacterium]
MPIIVGTSGWQYRDWRGTFYPRPLPGGDLLGHYSRHFATVENNSTFYRLPKPSVFADWAQRTPADFRMAVKASRYLTHLRRLREPAEAVARLLAAVTSLGDRLGPILLQLPPDFRADPERLEDCLIQFRRLGPVDLRIAVEPRHESWWTKEVCEVLVDYDAALVWADRRERPAGPLWRTCDWGYLRLHEGAGPQWPRYRTDSLHAWLDRIDDDIPDWYVYFNNDQHTAAVHDADVFAALARDLGHTVSQP